MNGWMVRLTHQAAQDIENILHWTFERFGPLQMAAYADVINDALDALVKWPHLLDARRRPELGDDVATLHVARQGRKGRHLVVFRVYEKGCVIEVLRILHDSMDLPRHFISNAKG